MLGRIEPQVGHELAGAGEPAEVTNLGDHGRGHEDRHAAQSVHRTRSQRPRWHEFDDCGLQPVAQLFGSLDARQQFFQDEMLGGVGELLLASQRRCAFVQCAPEKAPAVPQQEARS